MDPKKNSKADLSKRSLLFLQLGLILVLLISYFVIEWKSFDPITYEEPKLSMGDLDDEVMPVTVIIPTPPALPPPTIPDEIEVIDEDDPTPEDKISSTESFPDEIVPVKAIKEVPKDDPIEVPFEFIEDVPIFPGCEGLGSNAERKKCMSEKITRFVNFRFNKDLGNVGVSGVNRINVAFKIDAQGNIVDVQSRAPHPKLEQEAIRVIRSLPKMEPGKQRGKPVTVSYYLPIIFQAEQ